MGRTITHFMWSFQQHFRVSQECAAKRVFESLDSRFRPTVFLVGLLAEERDDRFEACVEPEDDFWIASEEFNGADNLMKDTIAGFPESKLQHSHPRGQQLHNDALMKRAIRDIIERAVNTRDARPTNLEYFASYPVLVAPYCVSIVVGLQESVLSSHYALTKGEVAIHEFRNITVGRSLIDATIQEFLKQAAGELEKPDAGQGLSSIDADETVRSAGNRLTMDCTWRIDQDCISGMHSLFRSCNTIASLDYERIAGCGTIVLARKKHPALQAQVTFATPIKATNWRAARKLLELAAGDIALHTDSEKIYGLVTLAEDNDDDEDLFEVRILEHHHWELLHCGESLMRVKYGQPYLPKPAVDATKLRADLQRIFPAITATHAEQITSLVVQAEQERHGTMLVITEAAAAEAERLRRQAIVIEPAALTPDLLKHLTPIDGAVLLAPDATCTAIGVILDGKATERGDPGRGARYNSALRYVAGSESPCLAVVVSEDRGIDVVPDLRPAIKKSDIDATIATLERIKAGEKVKRRPYLKALKWLEEHRFYLLPQHCDTINELVGHIDERLDVEEPSDLKIVRQPFVPDPVMTEQFSYLPE